LIRILLAIAAIFGLEIHQMDVVTAFLAGELEEEIYMEQPEGFEVGTMEDDLVCKKQCGKLTRDWSVSLCSWKF
jgi:hypothetical protein